MHEAEGWEGRHLRPIPSGNSLGRLAGPVRERAAVAAVCLFLDGRVQLFHMCPQGFWLAPWREIQGCGDALGARTNIKPRKDLRDLGECMRLKGWMWFAMPREHDLGECMRLKGVLEALR